MAGVQLSGLPRFWRLRLVGNETPRLSTDVDSFGGPAFGGVDQTGDDECFFCHKYRGDLTNRTGGCKSRDETSSGESSIKHGATAKVKLSSNDEIMMDSRHRVSASRKK
jgi:hypothetical protein